MRLFDFLILLVFLGLGIYISYVIIKSFCNKKIQEVVDDLVQFKSNQQNDIEKVKKEITGTWEKVEKIGENLARIEGDIKDILKKKDMEKALEKLEQKVDKRFKKIDNEIKRLKREIKRKKK